MANKIRLVRNDTAPQLVFSLTDENNGGAPIDVSTSAVTSMVFKFRVAGEEKYKTEMPVLPLPGIVLDGGEVDYTPPYNIAGVGGRCYMNWDAVALDAEGDYEGELEITFANGQVQTPYEIVKFTVRADFVTP